MILTTKIILIPEGIISKLLKARAAVISARLASLVVAQSLAHRALKIIRAPHLVKTIKPTLGSHFSVRLIYIANTNNLKQLLSQPICSNMILSCRQVILK